MKYSKYLINPIVSVNRIIYDLKWRSQESKILKSVIKLPFEGIGDQMVFSSLPENFYNFYNKKLKIVKNSNIWVFNNNPYVDLVEDSDECITPFPDTRNKSFDKYVKYFNTHIIASQAEYIAWQLNIDHCTLRHPKLYIKPQPKFKRKTLIVHTTGSDRTKSQERQIRRKYGESNRRIISSEAIEIIRNNYKEFYIIQVGAKDDVEFKNADKDLRGLLSFEEIATIIQRSHIFIGVDSGIMHIANSFPDVAKRIILSQYPYETLRVFRPSDGRNFLFSWLDINNNYFNLSNTDIGVTYSINKI